MNVAGENQLLDMMQVAKLLNMSGPDLARRVRRKLQAIAECRGGIQLFRLGERMWYTTLEDMRRLIPELFEHEAKDSETLRGKVERQAAEINALRQKVERLENTAWRQSRGS